MITTEEFQKNYKLIDKNTKGLVEKKGRYNYLSWGYAQKFLGENYPNIYATLDTSILEKGIIICSLKVREEVSDRLIFKEYLAITDLKNNPIATNKITQNDITFTYQRAFAKAVARYTGYGLALYTDEEFKQLEERMNSKVNSPIVTNLATNSQLKIIKDFINTKGEWAKRIIKAYCETIGNKNIVSFTKEEAQELIKVLETGSIDE